MKILLVLPAGENYRVTPERPSVPRRAMLRFSVLPLTTVASLTPPQHEVRIVDENVEPLDFEADCDLVGVSFMTALAPRAYAIAREFRKRGKIIVAGGYHATLCTAETLCHFDAVVVGDAEDTWPQVLRDIEAGRLQQVYRSAGGAMTTPIPRRDLLMRTARHYATVNAVQAGRGCRHACRYCSVTAFYQQTYRHRAVSDVLTELQTVSGNFLFVDDNIVADRDFARELFTRLVPLRKRWVAQCSIEVGDDQELLHLMHKAGCRGLFIGIETVNSANLTAMSKQFNNPHRYRQRLQAIRRAGMAVVAGIIVGIDSDDVGVFAQTLHFLLEEGIDCVQVNILTPLPGTPLFAEMERGGRITDCVWSRYDYRHVVFQPARMSAAQLQAGGDWMYAQFYRLDRIFWRFVRGLFTVGWLPSLLALKLGLTYRYDNQREGIVGRNPACQNNIATQNGNLYNCQEATT